MPTWLAVNTQYFYGPIWPLTIPHCRGLVHALWVPRRETRRARLARLSIDLYIIGQAACRGQGPCEVVVVEEEVLQARPLVVASPLHCRQPGSRGTGGGAL